MPTPDWVTLTLLRMRGLFAVALRRPCDDHYQPNFQIMRTCLVQTQAWQRNWLSGTKAVTLRRPH